MTPDQTDSSRALLARYLNEAHATETALVTTLEAHIALAPAGSYRDLLERHLQETTAHAAAVERRIADIGDGASLVATAVGLLETVLGQVLALSKGPIDALRGASEAERVLKNAKDECATEALEIATYDALEAAAAAVGDDATARMAARHLAEEERMLAGLRAELPALAAAVVREQVGIEAEAPDPAPAEVPEAADAEPLPGYDVLNAGQVIRRLPRLTRAQRDAVAVYERAHRNRSTVLARIDALQAGRRGAG